MNPLGAPVRSLGASRQSSLHGRATHLCLLCLAGIAAMTALCLLPADNTAHLAQDVLSWCLVGAIAVVALVATVKVLEGLLDT